MIKSLYLSSWTLLIFKWTSAWHVMQNPNFLLRGRIHEVGVEVLRGRIHHACFKVNNKNVNKFHYGISSNTCQAWCPPWMTMYKGGWYLGLDQGWKGGVGKSVGARVERWRSGKAWAAEWVV